ncbi:glycoside hydrolase domain-containing protein [Horticoccus sp. 23ND18S-11]|uniref:glycoside hydrolase domain-containing protein n=1 Tax=Horticoccus sp. 23ND18S-11 TaxID=3391832 RepID=UPI0039C944EF
MLRLLAALVLGGAGGGFAADAGSPASINGPYPAFGYPWENNSLGLERVVPAPWTPIRRERERLAVWGRTFDGMRVLPAQITSQGRALFARPPRLDLVIDQEDPFAGEPSVEVQEVADDRVRWRVAASRPAYRAEAEMTLEYDGLWMVALTITPTREVRLNRLVVELPWAAGVPLFYSRYVSYDYDRQSVDPADFFDAFGQVDRTVSFPFNPTVWIGNHDVGAEWICETDEGWSPRRAKDAITIEPSPAGATFQARVVTEQLRLNQPYRLKFALLPTPVKALPADWRRVRLIGARLTDAPFERGVDRLYAMNHPDFSIQYRGLPELIPTRPGAQVRDGSGVRYMPYGTLYGMPGALPRGEWKEYAPIWQTGNPRAVSRNPNFAAALGLPQGAVSIIHINPEPKSFQDFLVWEYAQAVDRWGIEALYWDFGSPHHPSRNPLHSGGAWVAQGGQFYPLFAQRALMKRVWIALKARNPEFFIMLHQVQTPVVVSGFADAILTGEALNRMFKGPGWTVEKARTDLSAYVPDYSKLPDVMWEAQYSQRRGFINMLLSQVIKWNDALMAKHPDVAADRTRTLLARTLVCDVSLSYMRNHRATLDAVIAAQNRFPGFHEATFVGPWESGPQLREGGHALKVALYVPSSGGRCFMVAANWSAAAVTEGIAPKVGQGRVRDAVTNRPLPVTASGAVELHVPPNDFRLLIWD